MQLKPQKRKLVICLSSTHTEPGIYQAQFHSLLPCEKIYSKDYQHGTLFALLLSKKTLVGTMDNQITYLDQSLQTSNGVNSTRFTSISDTLSGKIKTFGKREHKSDEHYRVIFTIDGHAGRKESVVHPDVNSWYPSKLMQAKSDTNLEYDVVKKRRAIDAVSPLTPAADDDPDALSAFEDFERNVLPALEAILEDERNNQRRELEEFEENNSKGIYTTTTGGVYFAWSSCLKCMKIGATSRDDPAIRLRELSSHVTTPFTLMGWIPTPTPFRHESLAHRHFVSKRIRNAGAGTEFFHIGREEAQTYSLSVVAGCDYSSRYPDITSPNGLLASTA